MKNLLLAILIVFPILAVFVPAIQAAPENSPPNVLMIVIDDIGYGDLSAHGHPWLKTPNLDRLHAQSVCMTDFLVSPTCAPTRAALMTGAHEFRSGVTHTIHGLERMNRECVILPQALKKAGYETGMFGKWHLGDGPGYQPWLRGFDTAVIAENDASGSAHAKALDPVFLFNGENRKMKGTRDILFAEEAMRFMKQEREQPFFCYYATYDPHRAHWAEDRFMKEMRIQAEAAKDRGILGVKEGQLPFFAEILQVDWIVGQLLDFLDANDLTKETLVVLMSDNGGTDGVDAFNSGMRGCKGHAWLGGTRAIAFWRLPGTLEPREVTQPCAHIDVLPTLAEVAGATIDGDLKKQVEGRSAWKLLTNRDQTWPERYLHAHIARWNPGERENHRYQGAMIRRGTFDLVRVKSDGRSIYTSSKSNTAATPDGDWALYDRLADPRQEHDLSSQHPELTKRMIAEFERWWDASHQFLINEKKR